GPEPCQIAANSCSRSSVFRVFEVANWRYIFSSCHVAHGYLHSFPTRRSSDLLSLLPKKLFRIRMSRNFGMKMLTMTNLSTECLIQLTKLGYDATPFNQILKQNAKREMRLRLGKVTVADVLAAQPVT